MKVNKSLFLLSPRNAKILVCLLTVLIAAVDFSLPANINIASLYFICVVLAVWTRSVAWLWTSTAVFILLAFGGLELGRTPIVNYVTWVNWLNRSMTALALVIVSIPVHLRLRAYSALELTAAERDHAQRALQQSHANLEVRVEQRTRELQAEIIEREHTELKLRESEQSLRRLSTRLIRTQDEERRRIARELHDSVGQYLAHAKMSLESWLRRPDTSDPGMRSLSQITDSLDKCLSETRTISHLLHPPLLDELGFASAAKAYVDGFSQRSSIHVNLNIPRELRRLPPALELVLFRVLQESLTNVLRHAQSATVDIEVASAADQIALQVQDHGTGMPAELVERLNAKGEGGGVGLAGMRERILEFRGNFEIRSDERGTTIRAVLPLTTAEPVKAAAKSGSP